MLAKLLRPLSVVGRLLRRTGTEWAEWAAEHPGAAAIALERAAASLEARAAARRRKHGWWTRRLREQARAFRSQAAALRSTSRQKRERACDVPPGRWR